MSESANPYSAPSATPLDDPGTAREVQLAGQGQRFLNFIIDYYLAQLVFGAVLGVLIAVIGGEAAIIALQDVPDVALSIPMLLLYFIICESAAGKTLGKLLTGTMVIDERGRKPTIGQIIGRSFARFIPFEVFSFLSANPRGWHDRLSKTMVIKTR